MASGALSRAGAIVSQAWCWWWEGGNLQSDELARVALKLLVITAAAICSYFTWRKKTGQGLPPLPPGPRGLPLVGSLPFLRPDLHRCFADLAKAYGPVMSLRLGTRLCLVVSTPAAAKEVLKDHDAVFANRDIPAAATVISYGGLDVVWNNHPANWRDVRKVCVRELMNPTTINAFYPLRRSEVRRMVRAVYQRCGTPVQVGEEAFLTLLDVMTNMLWGSTVGGEERSRVGKEFREVMSEITELLGMSNVSDLVPALAPFDLQRVERRMRRLHEWYNDMVSKIIGVRVRDVGEGADGERRRSSGQDFLQVMLDVVEKGRAEAPLTVDHVKAVMLDMIMGGTETSSTTVEWAMAEMMHNREILRKAQEELERVVGMDAVVEESHLPKLHYLDAIVKETFRLHPVAPLMVPRCPNESRVVGGHCFPAGTRVFINTWAIHRDPLSWEDPLQFNPERFLSDEYRRWNYHNGNDFRFLPFGSGRRICLGIPMAKRMTLFLLATFLHSFDWQLPVGVEVDLTETFGIILKMAKPLAAIPTPRLSSLQLLCMMAGEGWLLAVWQS